MDIEKCIKSVAIQQNLEMSVAREIVNSLFKQLRDNMSKSDLSDDESFKNFRIINFGLFYSDKEKRKRIDKKFKYANRK